VENANSEFGELAVFDEFAKVCERILFAARNEFDQVEHALHHAALEFVATLVAKDAAKEC
jgi:hypothetical protein